MPWCSRSHKLLQPQLLRLLGPLLLQLQLLRLTRGWVKLIRREGGVVLLLVAVAAEVLGALVAEKQRRCHSTRWVAFAGAFSPHMPVTVVVNGCWYIFV
jgi:hypothetical protein